MALSSKLCFQVHNNNSMSIVMFPTYVATEKITFWGRFVGQQVERTTVYIRQSNKCWFMVRTSLSNMHIVSRILTNRHLFQSLVNFWHVMSWWYYTSSWTIWPRFVITSYYYILMSQKIQFLFCISYTVYFIQIFSCD